MNKVILSIIIFIGCIFIFSQGRAEEIKMMDPLIDGKERLCLDCHRYPNIHTNEGVFSSQSLCYECHDKEACQKKVEKKQISLTVRPESFEKSRHKYVACIQCHTDVARSPHRSKDEAQCLGCHSVHGEGAIPDPHLRVRCQACHRTSKFVFLDSEIDRVRLSHFDDKKEPISLTDHALPDVGKKDFCKRCHHPDNQVGAAAAILPSKSILCIICHNAPMGVGHLLFWGAFLVFIVGLVITVRFWFRGSVHGEEESIHRKLALSSESVWASIFSREFFSVIKVAILDIILQRRILQESVKRWSIHSLIYLSVLGRFSLSLFAFLAYKLSPDSQIALVLINKNHGFTAFIYDLLGLFTILGIAWAITQRFIIKPDHVASEIQDNIAVSIIGVLILLGFFLEGARIFITKIPPEVAIYSFIGYPIARLISLSDWDWSFIYQYLWYAHALVAALFIAYIPFSKMKHVFNTPLNLLLSYKNK